MNAMLSLSSQPWVERLGWTLIHFLWQGTALALPYAAARAILPRASSRTLYSLACATLLTMIAAPFVTWELLTPTPSSDVLVAAAPASGAAAVPSGFTVPVASAAPQSYSSAAPFLPYVVGLWLIGSLAFWARLAGGWVVAARMRSMLVRRAPPEWQARVSELARRAGVSRPVRLLVSAIVQVPTVVGWLRPVILAPVGALAGLPAEHLEALLIHELAHIRRHDYVVSMLQGVAEALLFYHPAVWWVSGHIRAERELCCDDVAVSVSGDVLTYATALTELEGFRPRQEWAALAANGGVLAARIARLLGQVRPSPRTLSGPAIAVTGILLLAAAWSLFGQSETPKFEVAAIKPATPDPTYFRGIKPVANGRLSVINMPVVLLIQNAYGLQRYQIIGGPKWTDDDGFNIEAKGETAASRPQVLLMLRSLLEDRFQLRFHRETRELPIYALSVAKNGPRLPAPKEGDCVNTEDPNRPFPILNGARQPPCGSTLVGGGLSKFTMGGGNVPMAEFVRTLAMVLGKPVADHTGITASFDVNLTFARDELIPTFSFPGRGAAPPIAPNPDGPPGLIAVLQQQLGLKLETSKGPVEVMVIDGVSRPSEN
jgi:uncharacterized protein (TIGR03435 family)